MKISKEHKVAGGLYLASLMLVLPFSIFFNSVDFLLFGIIIFILPCGCYLMYWQNKDKESFTRENTSH
jgi:Ca2+/Na+ antiporter